MPPPCPCPLTHTSPLIAQINDNVMLAPVTCSSNPKAPAPPLISKQISANVPIPGGSSPNRSILYAEDGSVQQGISKSPFSLEQVLMKECYEDDGFEEEKFDYGDSEDDHVGGSKFFRTRVFEGAEGPSETPPAGAQPSKRPSLVRNHQLVVAVPGTSNLSKHAVGNWRNLFVTNRNSISCPKLMHYPSFTDTRGYNLLEDDLDSKYSLWKFNLIGYVAGKSPGFKDLNNVANSWNCEVTLSIHETG